MKKLILFFSVLFATASSAQVTLTGTSSQSLPAFFIIDKEPKSVAAVTDPNKLAATLLNVFDQKGGLKPDVAIEFAPFWLRDSSKMRMENLTSAGSRWQSLAFSVATSNKNDANTSGNGQRLGMGFRWQPFQTFNNTTFNDVKQMLRLKQQLVNLLTRIPLTNAAFATGISSSTDVQNQINTEIDAFPGIPAGEKQNAKDALSEAIENVQKNANEQNEMYLDRVVAFILQPIKTYAISDFYDRDWKFEIAGATGMHFPTNDIGFSYISRVGIWANYSHIIRNDAQREVASLNFTGRMLKSFSDSVTTNYDLGASFTAKWWKSLPVSLEFVGRHYAYEYNDINQAGDTISRIDRKNTYRLALTADFAIDKDLSLNFTFGRDYDKPFQTSGNLLGIFGLNYTFGTRNKLTN